jgi:hypothetical protein
VRRSVAVCAAFLAAATSACSSDPQAVPEARQTVTVAPTVSSTPSPSRSTSPAPPATASAEKTCAKGSLSVLSAAIADVVAKEDVGQRYARATRTYGKQSDEWRLASVLFPPVYAQLDAHGEGSAEATATALTRDGCGRLYKRGSAQQRMNLRNAQPIELPGAAPEPSQSSQPSPTRSCYLLEEQPHAFSGTWLRPETRGQNQDEVREVQSQLNWWGYGCTPEDGDYGPVTVGLVREFQRDMGIYVDGNVGPQTWRTLFGVS